MAKNSAGVLVVAYKTSLYPGKPLLLGKRSKHLRTPHTWSGWGGEMNPGETPAEAAIREFREEAGFRGTLTLVPGSEWEHAVSVVGLIPLYTFHNHLGTVENQFEPQLDSYEVEDARWMSLDEVEALPRSSLLFAPPGSLHFGLVAYLGRPEIRRLLTQLCEPDQTTTQ